MSAISTDQVAHLAALARIELSATERVSMAAELGVILDAVARVGEVSGADVSPMSHPLPLVNVSRPDEVRPSLAPTDVLANAPETQDQRFVVPRILTQD
ncbi:MAG: Asp-tRNA(Asn)/Glu-tRNA(Gln) amidotransferase subunit GatC [Austwickia sp.]|jgi:aspartyl-tRNA(Asn)/glutamyl-tRNA(Gln) amidotransferase subunit C|nr:Asp-tRNA(Asn)/Glu-tRNA(Gln) amidotransferase subunit GatC [Austwickia sp.]MBK8436918.1 Asp-tRNA(Asn)/Glu-tRNA(Gln) amidotransferase subunit GatC [Austwickia sp.]MBK9100545.1 Asp-tRNA(Asn)/Glu-tRNA(Gln) amidotransferase subunit GatC [Austwickia sp.]